MMLVELGSGGSVTRRKQGSQMFLLVNLTVQEIVNINFDFFDPKPNDFHGIKALLRTYLDDEVWDISGFVDLVLAQTTVGTVIKAGDEGNPIALLTALNLGRYQVVFSNSCYQVLIISMPTLIQTPIMKHDSTTCC
jgi:hypothetical protein